MMYYPSSLCEILCYSVVPDVFLADLTFSVFPCFHVLAYVPIEQHSCNVIG